MSALCGNYFDRNFQTNENWNIKRVLFEKKFLCSVLIKLKNPFYPTVKRKKNQTFKVFLRHFSSAKQSK